MELDKILLKLIGNIECTGSHERDMEAIENLNTLNEVLRPIIMKIGNNIAYEDRNEASMSQVGKESRRILERLKRLIDDYTN